VTSASPQFHGEFKLYPFVGLKMNDGTKTVKTNGFEISMLADSRWMVQNMYKTFAWGDHSVLVEHPTSMYDLIYTKDVTNEGLESEIKDEHDAFRTAIVKDPNRLTRFSLFSFEDDVNHELVMVSDEDDYPIGKFQKLDSNTDMNGKVLTNTIFYRLSWRVVTKSRLLQNTASTTKVNRGLEAMNDLLKSM
jgi:hypothetical protein